MQFVPITTDALAVAKLTHLELGNSIEKSYEHYFPSLSGSFIVTENTLFRFGYAKTIGRPDFANYLPTININRVNNAGDTATGAGLGTINAKNPALKPWLAHNLDLSLEYYRRQDAPECGSRAPNAGGGVNGKGDGHEDAGGRLAGFP